VADSIPPLRPFELEELSADGSPPPGAQARVRAKLEIAIPEIRRAGGGGGHGGRVRGWRGGIAWPVATFALGGMAGAALAGVLERAPPPRVVYVEPPAPTAVQSAGPAPTEVASATAMVPNPAMTGPASAGPPGPQEQSQLEAERRLLDDARAALVAEIPDRALENLAAHRSRFPKAILAEERDALEIQALVRAGRYREARDRARAFGDRWPESLFGHTVRSAIASIP
jgi:hypothetical protein